MEAKLAKITTQYHTFEDNQVLTKDQLNEFINYFEDQDRLTRIILSGVGIVCGFQLDINSSNTKITIGQGGGVTTDGDLIKLRKDINQSPLKNINISKVDFTHFKVFEDSFADYKFFKKQLLIDGKKKTIPLNLWELLPGEGENTSELNKLPNLKNKVVLLYLESYAKEGDLCTSIDCDNQGVEQVARLRVLLVSKADAAYIAGLDSIYSKHNVVVEYFKLPEVAVRRVVLNEVNSSAYDMLKGAYYKALINEDKLQVNLFEGISKIVTSFDSILDLKLNKSSLLLLKSKLKSILNFSAYNVPFNIQYRYDCVKDIVDTYNEIKCLLLALKEECCPDINAFPKHLMLGCLDEIGSEAKHYRHQFYKSPILNCGTDNIQQAKNLVTRLFEIVNGFKTSIGEIKITPSKKLLELSYRTIPFYYNVKSGLLNSWNYFKTDKNKENTNLCYHTSSLSPAPQIQTPLNYNTDSFDFYRIEGHQGQDYKLVLEEIGDLKKKHGLAFDVKALSVNVNSDNLNVDEYQCEFEDLNVLLRAWTAEQECTLAQVSGFFSGFSTKVPGENIKEPQLNLSHRTFAESDSSTGEKTTSFLSFQPKVESKLSGTFIKKSTPISRVTEVISENLTTEKDALGSVMKVAFEETKGGSVNDIIARSKTLVAEKVNTDEWNSQPDVKIFVIDQSIELMAHAHVLSNRMPGSLVDVSDARVETYKTTMNDLCALVKKMKAAYQTVNLTVGMKAFIGIFINQLSIVCCSGKKLQILLEEIGKRKESILLRLQLSKFVEKHPGLEHKAGVQPGGTFILVYLNKVLQQPSKRTITRAEFSAVNFSAANSLFKARNSLSTLKNIKVQPEIELALTNINRILDAETLLKTENANVFERFIKTPDVANNTVVADFALPYMCCSDCAPVNFIIQKPKVSLRLEKDEFCLGKDTSPLLFDVTPDDGIIKANPQVTGLTIDGTKLLLNPATFPNDMLGKPIQFTVNDQITDTQITLYRAVQFDFAVPESPTSETTIDFKPSGNIDGATFLWSFGDDNLSTERNPTHTYKLPIIDENKVTVSLTVKAANGVCQNTVEHEIEFVVEDTVIELEKKDYCENDEKSYPFLVTPNGTEAKIEGKGVIQQNSGDFAFIPAAVDGAGEISFKLNGEPSGVSVTIHKAPVLEFTPAQLENQLVLNNESTNAESYIWVINDKEIEVAKLEPMIIDLNPDSPTLWKLQLRAINKFCGTLSSRIIEFETSFKEEEITIELENTTFCENDEKDYQFVVTPTGADAKIAGSGVRLVNGGFVFSPASAGPGDVTFTLNGSSSGLSVTIHNAPVAKLEAKQIGNQLILTNQSTNAESYIWVVNGIEETANNGEPHIIPITQNSPNNWKLQLRAISKLCGADTSAEISIDTKFIEEPRVDNCIDETKGAIVNDLRTLTKLQNPNSDFVQQIWLATSKLYGGTAEFKAGVLNDIDNYLSGKNNEALPKLFVELLTNTSNIIVEVDRNQQPEEFNQLVKLFELQLQLFYNILGCQNPAVIKEFTDAINQVLGQIIELLIFLKRMKVIFADSMKAFVKIYSGKVNEIELLLAHIKRIVAEKLI